MVENKSLCVSGFRVKEDQPAKLTSHSKQHEVTFQFYIFYFTAYLQIILFCYFVLHIEA